MIHIFRSFSQLPSAATLIEYSLILDTIQSKSLKKQYNIQKKCLRRDCYNSLQVYNTLIEYLFLKLQWDEKFYKHNF